jgi:hypothetical protein
LKLHDQRLDAGTIAGRVPRIATSGAAFGGRELDRTAYANATDMARRLAWPDRK